MHINKGFRALQYIAVISALNTFTNFLPVPAALSTWISWAIMAAMTGCMLWLPHGNRRYQKAGFCRGAMLLCSLITTFLYNSRLFLLAASVLSIMAVYQEFHGHAELVENKDAQLAQKWRSLFLWEIIAGFILSIVSTVTAILLIMQNKNVSAITGMIIGRVPQLVIDFVYLRYLQKLIIIFREDSEVQSYDR